MDRIPKVSHIVYIETPHGENAKGPDLSGFPDSVKVVAMSQVETEGAKPENCKISFTKMKVVFALLLQCKFFSHEMTSGEFLTCQQVLTVEFETGC